jgi:two-component system sensor kinase FixL
MNFFQRLFSPGFMPHGYCYMWEPRMVWLHVISDGLITVAYSCIPIILIYFIRKNRSLPLNKVFWMFGVFILACGTTHAMEIWNIWHAAYFVAGLVKVITATASVVTAIMLIPLVPRAMRLPDLINSQKNELSNRLQAEARLQVSLSTTEKALNDLAESRELLRLLLDGITNYAIYTLDIQGNVTSWNTGAASITGYSSEEILGDNFACFYTLEDRANGRPRRDLQQTSSQGRFEDQGQRVRKDGSMFWANVVVSPIYDVSGTHKGFSMVTRDISQQKLAEDELKQQAAMLHLAHDAIIVHDHQGRVVFWSRGAKRLYGWSEQEALGRVTHDLLQTKFPVPLAAIKTALATCGDWEGELTHATRDGGEVLVESRWAVKRRESSKDNLILEINRDLTGRKLAEGALRQSLAASAVALKGLEDQKFALDQHAIVAITDVQGRISYVNDKFCAISGYCRGELIGQNHRILNSGYHPNEFFHEMYQQIASGKVWHAEIKNRAKGGSFYWVDTTIVPFIDGGKPRQYVAIRADVTERKRAEEDLVKMHRELETRNIELEDQTVELQRTRAEMEQRVIARTKDLAAVNETLERSNIELKQFAYIASHDLQSPLRSISGFVQVLKMDYEEKLDDKGRDYIRRTVQSITQMQSLIRDLLAYSRVDLRSRPFVGVPLMQVFQESVSILDSSVRDAAARVTCDELPIVWGDSSQLSQLLQNLIGNGLKYHGTEPPHVHVSAEPGTKENEWLISVHDNGIGIDPKYFGRIFDIFQRLHDQNEYPGTGIGLAVCRRVVERHGGAIWVESEPGHGSSFRFSISADPAQSTNNAEKGKTNDQSNYQCESG